MDKIRSLLTQVAIISKKNEEILDATGGRFNMFRICGVNHYENTHSAIIAELFNPNGTHGLKSKLLRCFIDRLDKLDFLNFNSEKARVYTEYSTEEGRIDILIEDDQNKAIIIENKIYAKDQPEQLKRYNKYARKYKNGYQILYLTLSGNDASVQSGEGVSYLSISHAIDIINWLEKCVAIASRFPIVRETIIQYINHLKWLTNQDMDTKNKEEITEILSKIENLKAAEVIYQNYNQVFEDFSQKYFNPKMEKFAEQNSLEYHYEYSKDSHIRFYFTNPDWQGKYWIGFTSDSTGYYYGLVNEGKNYMVSDKNRKTLALHLDNLGVISRKQAVVWAFYSYIPILTLDSWIHNIVESDNFFNECKEKVETLLKAMEGIEF